MLQDLNHNVSFWWSKNFYNDFGMSNKEVLATLDKFLRILFFFLFVNGWSLLSYSTLIFNVKRDTWGLYVLFEKNINKKNNARGYWEEIMHHALLNFKEWRLIEMHKKFVFYRLNRIKAAVHPQRVIIELVFQCNSFKKIVVKYHVTDFLFKILQSRLDFLTWS